MTSVTVRIKQTSSKDFYKAVSKCKSLHGTFDSESKMWRIPAQMTEFIKPWDGLEILSETTAPKSSSPSVCSVCGGKVNYSERYARPGYCGCEGE